MRWRIPVVSTLALLVAVSCDQPPVEPVDADVASDLPAFKVDRADCSFVVDLGTEIPYDCTDELLQPQGLVLVNCAEKTTPSGNTIVSAHVDYEAFDGVYLDGLTDVWTNTNGHNPFGEVIKDNGFYQLHYHWHEFYRNQDGERLKVHLKGHFAIAPDGTVKIDREVLSCM
jgi:hypothetical protein